MLRRIFYIFVFVLSVIVNSIAQPIIVLPEIEYNFGTINGTDLKFYHSFSFFNAGTDTLKISEISTSCSCVSIQKYDNNLPPGVTGKFAIDFNTKGISGQFGKTITVKSNAQNGNIDLKIFGTITPTNTSYDYSGPFFQYGNLKFSSPKLSFDTVLDSKVIIDSVLLVNVWTKPIKIEFEPFTGSASYSIFPSEIKPDGSAYLVVKYDPTLKKTYGDFTERIQLNTNDSLMPKKQFSIRGYIKEDFSVLTEKEKNDSPILSIESEVFDFGEISQGKTVEATFLIENKGKSDLIFRKIKPACGCTTTNAELSTLKPGEKYTLKFKFNTQGRSGIQEKSIELITNDPEKSISNLRITGKINSQN